MKKDIDDFSYKQGVKPERRQFGIMTLSDNGFKEYIDKESYTHYYLYEKHLDKYNKEMDERLKIKQMSQMHFRKKEDKHNNSPNGEIIPYANEEGKEKESHVSQVLHTDQTHDHVPNLSHNNYNQVHTYRHNPLKDIHLEENYTKIPNHLVNINECKTSRNKEENTRYLPLQTAPGFYKNSTKNNFKTLNLQTKPIRFIKMGTKAEGQGEETNHMAVTLHNLKQSLSSFRETFTKTDGSFKGGFTSTQVPRVDHLYENKLTHSDAFKFHNKKFLLSIGKDIEGENLRIKRILDDANVPLPKIKKRKEPLPKRYFSQSKFMGEKYDPSTFDYIFSNSNTKRNVYGALFHH
jgi:hypothetical protein